jgi:hypothetical protein
MTQQYRAATLMVQPAYPQAEPDYDVRDITVGMPVAEIPEAGYVNLTRANDTGRKLQTWSACVGVREILQLLRRSTHTEPNRAGVYHRAENSTHG